LGIATRTATSATASTATSTREHNRKGSAAYRQHRGDRPGPPCGDPRRRAGIALHDGPFSELDQTYGALGTFVAERELGIEGPIREHYLISALDTADEAGHRTEVCWPIFRTHDALEAHIPPTA
jgi:hypothetical protein